MLRVNNGVLVVPPFEAAWLTGEGFTLRNGTGCVSFEAKGETDVTVILKSTPGAKRLQPLLRQTATAASGAGHSGGNALQVEENYTIIFGSHRNSCLKIEKVRAQATRPTPPTALDTPVDQPTPCCPTPSGPSHSRTA